MIRIGVIGCGYWGPNLVRNFMEVPASHVVAVSDLRQERLKGVQTLYPSIQVTTQASEVTLRPDIDAIVIATPVSTHFELAIQALKAGKHVFVEKPMTVNSEQASRLIEEAERRKLTLMVGHTFVYAGAVQKIKELVNTGHLGELYYYDSVRINLGLFQTDVNVIWDLAVHDLSIMDYVLPVKPCAIAATGLNHVPDHPENMAYLTLFYNTPMIGHIHVNWLAPVKIRHTLIGGDQRMIVYDDLEPSEKVKIYERGVTLNDRAEDDYRLRVEYRSGDMWAPQFARTEPLHTEAAHFIRCIESTATPISDGEAGLRIVQLLEAASASLANKGRMTELKWLT